MNSRTLIYIGIAVGGGVGSWIGSLLDNGSYFGLWGIVLSTVGGLAGIWAGYKIANL
jgi:hypothetical protein